MNSRPIRSGSSLTAPSFSGPGRGVSTAPWPSEEELQVPCCHPYGVRAMWSVRSRRGRLGTAPGSLGVDAGLAVRFLPAAVPPVSLIPRARIHAVASPNRSSTLAAREAPVRAYRTRWLHCGFHQHVGRARCHCRERPPTESAHLHLHLHAAVAVAPLPLMPARSPAARRLTATEQRLPLSGLGSELGVGFRAGGVR